MVNRKVFFFITFFFLCIFIVEAHAGLISVKGPLIDTDLYSISHDPPGAAVQENYGGDLIIPYGDGFAAVAGGVGAPIFFDKRLTFDFSNPAETRKQQTTWKIANTTEDIIWTDYHFEILESDIVGEDKPSDLNVFFTTPAGSADFQGVSLFDDTLNFFSPPDGKVVGPGETFNAHFAFGFEGVSRGDNVEVLMRQVATVSSAPAPVPEPATMLLLGVGLIGLAGWGRKRFKKK